MEVIIMLLLAGFVYQADVHDSDSKRITKLESRTNMYRWEARAAYCRHEMKFCRLTPETTCQHQYEKCEVEAYHEYCLKSGECNGYKSE